MKKVLGILLALALALGMFSVGASAAAKSSDTVLVLDYSGSMDGEPLANLKEAAVIFCEGIATAPGTNRVAIVIYDDEIQFQGFTQDLSKMRTFINDTYAGGRTNISDALKKAGELMSTSSADVKYVLLMTDGMPNEGSYVESGKYTSADHLCYPYANAAYNAAVDLWSSCHVYTLGYFHSLDGEDKAFGERFLKDMENDGYWEVIDPENIQSAFDEILDEMIDEMQITTERWWEILPSWLQWILRWLLGGWLWMDLF